MDSMGGRLILLHIRIFKNRYFPTVPFVYFFLSFFLSFFLFLFLPFFVWALACFLS